jgi:hypothetical protein
MRLRYGQADIEVIDADVLILDGGFAATVGALCAGEFAPRTVLPGRTPVSRSGPSAISGGLIACPLDSDDLDACAEEFIVHGSYTRDQDWTRQLLGGPREAKRTIVMRGPPRQGRPHSAYDCKFAQGGHLQSTGTDAALRGLPDVGRQCGVRR